MQCSNTATRLIVTHVSPLPRAYSAGPSGTSSPFTRASTNPTRLGGKPSFHGRRHYVIAICVLRNASLSTHVHLPPLVVGDCVRIQNQTGPHPTKWDKTGIVVEVRQFDQYVVRVDGSGRVTLRNRKFLRKYLPVVPRAPLALAPGPSTVLPSQPLGRPANRDTNIATPPAPPPPGMAQPNHNGAPSTQDASPDPTVPLPSADHPPQPNTDSATATRLPRALRALLPHNVPGLMDQPIPAPAASTPAPSPVTRHSTRPTKPPSRLSYGSRSSDQ